MLRLARLALTHKGPLGPLVLSVHLIHTAIEAWAQRSMGNSQILGRERVIEMWFIQQTILHAGHEAP
eukprot:1147680-Pelagomonas_calceolata.AAC.1